MKFSLFLLIVGLLSVQWDLAVTPAFADNDIGYIGCYVDNPIRDLIGPFSNTATNSIQYCRKACQGYAFFGVQFGTWCFCGNSYGRHGKADENACNYKCSGNNAQICGGFFRNSVYKTAVQEEIKPPQPADLGTRGYLGCYTDSSDRDLNGAATSSDVNSVQNCRQTCKGFTYFGTENGNECYCGNSYGKHGKTNENNCNSQCSGNSGQICGGSWILSVYRVDGQEQNNQKEEPQDSDARGYVGCYSDRLLGRDLNGHFTTSFTNSIQNCRRTCQGFAYFGLQLNTWCFCGNSYGRHGKADENSCNLQCSGNNKQVCGGALRNSVYRTDGQEEKRFQ